MSSGPIHLAIAIPLAVYLAAGIRANMVGLLKLLFAAQVVGDLVFNRIWAFMPTYDFLRYVADADRTRAALLWGAATIALDGGVALARLVNRAARTLTSPRTERRVTSPDAQRDSGISVGATLLAVAVLCKLIYLAHAGVFTGAKSVGGLQPEDTVGVGGVVFIGDVFLPLGLVIWRRASRTPRTTIRDLAIMSVFAFTSHSKAALISYMIEYGIAFMFAFGTRAARRAAFSWTTLVAIVLALANLAIKTQQRAKEAVSGSSAAVSDAIVSGASARFMGGIFRTQAATAREQLARGAPGLNGSYDEQVLYLWIPRALWPEKPDVQAEQLYYILGVTQEAFGTAFAVGVYGFLLLDYGLVGMLIGTFIVGAFAGFGDDCLRLRRARPEPMSDRAVFWWTAWTICGIGLSEGGVPIAIIELAMAGGAFIGINITLAPVRGIARLLRLPPAAAGSNSAHAI